MTDKQIIIDGVDVSGCKKYEHEIVRCNATLKNICFCGGRCTDKKNADCDFKQLKRKEQECEELKSDLTDLSKIIDCKNGTILTFKEQLDKLKQTLTEIKEIAENVQSFVDIRLEDDVYTEMYKILQKISECKVKNEYNTKDIRHINENNQEYIAEGNRMTKNEKRTKGAKKSFRNEWRK